MKALKILYILAILIFAGILIDSYFLFSLPPEKTECGTGEEECLNKVAELRETCKPSTSIVTIGNSTNYIRLRITIYKEGDKCITNEEVIDDSNSDIAPYNLTGYNITCNLSSEELAKYGIHACGGSLFDYIAPGDSGGGASFGDGTPESIPPNIYCSIYDTACRERAVSYIKNCADVEIMVDDEIGHTTNGTSYWTVYINVERLSTTCQTFYEVTNIVNLPPEMPPQIMGMNMTCTVPLSEFPITGLHASYCKGDLMEYIHYSTVF